MTTRLDQALSSTVSQTTLRPILRWAGSKRKLLPNILQCVPGFYKRYIEPFVGSGCVYLALQPAHSTLSDINRDLIDTYIQVRNCPQEVAHLLQCMPTTSTYYYELRDGDIDVSNPLLRAARFVYLNRFCFNGVYRTNRAGHFNVPRGSKPAPLPTSDDFIAFAAALASARLKACDFELVVNEAEHDDFVYVDPPYTAPGTRYRGEYGIGSFSVDDIGRLLDAIRGAADRGAIVLLSYNDTVGPALHDWYKVELEVRRSIAGFAQHRVTVKELLYSNRPIAVRGPL